MVPSSEPAFLESPESSMRVRNIGFGSKEGNLGSFGLLSITSQITLFVPSDSCLDTTDFSIRYLSP